MNVIENSVRLSFASVLAFVEHMSIEEFTQFDGGLAEEHRESLEAVAQNLQAVIGEGDAAPSNKRRLEWSASAPDGLSAAFIMNHIPQGVPPCMYHLLDLLAMRRLEHVDQLKIYTSLARLGFDTGQIKEILRHVLPSRGKYIQSDVRRKQMDAQRALGRKQYSIFDCDTALGRVCTKTGDVRICPVKEPRNTFGPLLSAHIMDIEDLDKNSAQHVVCLKMCGLEQVQDRPKNPVQVAKLIRANKKKK